MIPYPAYKSTNLPWLPKIPEHWGIVRCKQIFRPIDVRSEKGEEQLLSVSERYGVVKREQANVTMFKAASYEGYKLCWPDDLAINSLWAWSYGLGFSPYHGIISTAYSVFRLKDRTKYLPRFYDYLLRSKDFHWELRVRSKGLWKSRYQLSDDAFLAAPILQIPVAEQEQIVRYLDSMTAKINKLIRAKKKQIALLQEQRQAIINQAVTKGLAPNVEMKDSGQPRIGAIPRHWLLKEVKRMCRLQGGSGFPVEYQGNFSECIPFIKVNSLSSHISTTRQYDTVSIETSKLLNAKIFSQGDIVFAKVGAALLLHRFEILPFDCCIDNNMMAMYNISENVYWLKYALSLLDFNDLVNPGAVPSISQTQVGSLLIPCPPKSEQMEIVSHIEKHSSKINSLISRIEHSIDCLQEYKNSLISSVVTGQTDVRDIPVEDVIPDDLISEDNSTSEIEEDNPNDLNMDDEHNNLEVGQCS